MTLVAVLIAFFLEYYFLWGEELRNFQWFGALKELLSGWFGEDFMNNHRAGLAILLLLPPLLLLLFINLFDGWMYGLVLLIVSCSVLFYCLGPKSLKTAFKDYYDAMERGDCESGFLKVSQFIELNSLPEGDDLIRNASRVIFVESHVRYFGVIFWFIFLGPFGALLYRLAHICRKECIETENEAHISVVQDLLHWMDWLPVRLTSFLFLLTGDFAKGIYRLKDYLSDFSADNNQVISETGVSALGIELGMSESCLDENKSAMALVERTFIFYIVLAIGLSPFSFW